MVVLDAGHGGSDSGAVNSPHGLLEKEETLDVARRLKALLEADGYAVCMTRTGDQTLSNNDRYAYANATGARAVGPNREAVDPRRSSSSRFSMRRKTTWRQRFLPDRCGISCPR